MTVLVMLLLVVVAGDGWLGFKILEFRGHEARNNQVLGIARQEVTNLLTISSSDADSSIAQIARLATGEFLQQLTAQRDAYSQAIRQGVISSTAVISDAGIRQIGDDDASILVSAVGTVRSSAAPQPTQRRQHLLVQLVRRPDGWLVSRLGFLP
jgi:Mce-associated membrane protein